MQNAGPKLLGARHCLYLGIVFCGIAIYGSFVPFRFRTMAWTDAVDGFQAAQANLGTPSRSDLAANLLLFVPIGFCFAGASLVDRSPRPWLVVVVVPSALVLSLLIEFAQVWFPPRTPSLVDVAAQLVGSLGGIAAGSSRDNVWLNRGDELYEVRIARECCRHTSRSWSVSM